MTTVMKGDTWHMGMTRRSKRRRVPRHVYILLFSRHFLMNTAAFCVDSPDQVERLTVASLSGIPKFN
jgi:hypothetical protein